MHQEGSVIETVIHGDPGDVPEHPQQTVDGEGQGPSIPTARPGDEQSDQEMHDHRLPGTGAAQIHTTARGHGD